MSQAVSYHEVLRRSKEDSPQSLKNKNKPTFEMILNLL